MSRRKVEVVVCPGPTFLGGPTNKPRESGGVGGRDSKQDDRGRGGEAGKRGPGGKRKRREVDDETEDFKRMWKSVMQLGTSQLQGYDKRTYEARQTVEMGGLAPKSQKVPYKILKGVRAKVKHKLAKQEQENKESGLVVGKVRGLPTLGPQEKKRKGSSSSSRGHDPFPVVGKMKGGTLHLKRDVASRLGGGGGKRR